MDAPRLSWKELKRLAADRDNWCARVRLLSQPPRVQVEMNDDVAGARVHVKAPAAIPPKTKSVTTAMSKYRARDEHEAFFRPGERKASRHKYNTRSRTTKSKPKALTRPKALTDKERATWTREHYEQHHATTTLTTPPTTDAAAPTIPQVATTTDTTSSPPVASVSVTSTPMTAT